MRSDRGAGVVQLETVLRLMLNCYRVDTNFDSLGWLPSRQGTLHRSHEGALICEDSHAMNNPKDPVAKEPLNWINHFA